MPRTIRCAHCRCRFRPAPRGKRQRFCSNKACQRARKTRWPRDKMTTAPDSQANPSDAQRHWQHQHPHDGRPYRQTRAGYCARHRLLPQHRDQQRRRQALAKMDASGPVSFRTPGIYPLIPAVGEHLAKMDVFLQRCHVLPST
jgi:hypothetical protein